MSRVRAAAALALLLLAAPAHAADPVAERSMGELAQAMRDGRTTARALVRAYQRRIARLDDTLGSVVALNPDALAQAAALDAERRAGRVRGPLHGLPLLIKDNIETADRMPTTAGSLALKDNYAARDAPLVARLRAAGAVILGKTNLSEWANIRSPRSSSGWSAVGGLTRNPYDPARTACGSSSGSGAATAVSLAAAAVGTETDGSVTCPAAVNGLVGMKPTVGLVSRTHVVPISHSQDTPGPMARSVRDAALLLAAMAGADPADPATAGARVADYAAALAPDALRGRRIGVLRFAVGGSPQVRAVFEAASDDLRRAGAVLVDVTMALDRAAIREAENLVLSTELKADMAAYLATTDPARVPARTLADLIAFNRAHADTELRWFGQERFEEAERSRGLDDPAYRRALATGRRLAGPEGIDAILKADRLDALVAPTTGPASMIDLVNGDHGGGGIGAGGLAAVAGYPHLTVPMGQVEGLPVGLSLIGPAWSDARLLAMGHAYEQASRRRRPPTSASVRLTLQPVRPEHERFR